MVLRMRKVDWIFLALCLGIGILAEEAFTRSQIGISYFVFIAAFYSAFFWRFRGFPFRNQRLGWLLLGAIWLLSASYFLFDSDVFYGLNLLAIPALVVIHIALITGPKQVNWAHPVFLAYILRRIGGAIAYNAGVTRLVGRLAIRKTGGGKGIVAKKILIGAALSIPVLAVVLNLLISADSQFERILSGFPDWFSISGETVFRIVAALFYTFVFFGYMQVNLKRRLEIRELKTSGSTAGVDPVTALTVLILLDAVYVLFVGVQFKYFFSGTLGEGFTYAEYARRGFFELIFVSLINLTVTVSVLTFSKKRGERLWRTVQGALAILVVATGVILTSAFMRLMMYEEAYGFTFTRVLVHSFMIFLLVIFCYTFAKIWLARLSLLHFYFISSLVFYTAINVVGIDHIVVDRNLERYAETGKIDLRYLANMSDTGTLGLIKLYREQPEVPGLKELLLEKKQALPGKDRWQSYNLTRYKAEDALKELQLGQ
ncbi:DUF4153 domain-containing protein [Bacillus sp. FJAT-27245]|uniref:DUF4153 domain-containing protein n=1 Tax=Bacillus sp. FJAT-27245 TaxID=1684144 RepID=UPI0006A785C4|nr:DUF4173 domain-containing protein [Bacillus sp. FJAT-27245]